jgi:predicted molibdopterin-dependent oxidoreductase YjgC
MTRGKFSFSVFSGGEVAFDLDTCWSCPSKACVSACNAPNLGCVLELKENVPALRVSAEEAARGGCVECLACELACAIDGNGGILFSLPMPELDAYLAEMTAQGMTPGFRRA